MKRVLVVDDSRSARMVFIRCLKIVGYGEAEFVEAADGLEALEILAEDDHVDLVMLDLNMPRMDGLTLLERLKRRPGSHHAPIVVASSLVNDVLRARLYAEGVHAIVEKPISPVSLIAAVSGLNEEEGAGAPDGIRLDESFDRAVSETFEGIVFTSVSRQRGAPMPAFEEPVLWARIGLIAPPLGELVLVVEDRLARRLEEIVTGTTGDDATGRLELLGEMSNALAGRWARRVDPDGERITLALPQTGRGEWGAVGGLDVAVYVTDERDRILLARIRPVR